MVVSWCVLWNACGMRCILGGDSWPKGHELRHIHWLVANQRNPPMNVGPGTIWDVFGHGGVAEGITSFC